MNETTNDNKNNNKLIKFFISYKGSININKQFWVRLRLNQIFELLIIIVGNILNPNRNILKYYLKLTFSMRILLF